ncbi:MAG: acetyl-CoA carboxylase biotin carboxylase subunit family protein [Desulfopila sp.]
MNCIFLSPQFPPQYYHFSQQLGRAGANALGIGDTPYEALMPAVRQSLTEYYRVNRMDDYDELLRACGYFTHKYGKIDRIDSLNEYWLATEARLRDDFHVYGPKEREVLALRRKSVMKEKFREAGIPVAPGRLVTTLDDARQLIEETGYPVVAKPDSGVGALGTYRLENDTDLQNFIAHKPAEDYIIEGFVKGTIHSFDGLTDTTGKPVFLTSHVFSQGIMETVHEKRHLFYFSQKEIPAALQKAGLRCLDAFNIKERFFHIEFFHTKGDEFVGLEVNMRPPGGFTTDMFNYACNIDIYRIWAELLVKNETKPAVTRTYHCCYASRRDNIRYLHDHEEIIARYGEAICQVNRIPAVLASALGEVGYIFRVKEQRQMMEIVNFIHRTEHMGDN